MSLIRFGGWLVGGLIAGMGVMLLVLVAERTLQPVWVALSLFMMGTLIISIAELINIHSV